MKSKVALDEMIPALKTAYGDSLEAIILYGSSAFGEPQNGRADYNLLVVVRQVSLANLARSSQAVARWVDAGNPPPLIFSHDEWRASADIFPMEYADVLESHRILVGALRMDGVEVKLDYLRLQLEQEAMGKLLWVRQAAAIAGDVHGAQSELLHGVFSKILVLLRGLLRLHGARPPHDKEELIRQSAALASFNAESLLVLQRSVSNRATMHGAQSAEVLQGVLSALELLVSHVNAYQPVSRTYVAGTPEFPKGDRSK